MTTSNTARSNVYDPAARHLHWTIFGFVAFLAALGLTMGDYPKAIQPFWINIHVTVGLVFFLVVLARVAYRVTHKPPEFADDVVGASRHLSHPVHMLMYALLLIIPVLGIVARVWHGRTFDFGLFALDFGVKQDKTIFHPAEDYHVYAVYLLLAFVAFHICAALWHRFVKRDSVMGRMLPALATPETEKAPAKVAAE